MSSARLSGPEDVVARVGGDEFGVILPEVDEAVARVVTKRLQNRLEEHNRSYPDRPLQWSLGMATRSKDVPISQVLREAEEKMSEEKTAKSAASR